MTFPPLARLIGKLNRGSSIAGFPLPLAPPLLSSEIGGSWRYPEEEEVETVENVRARDEEWAWWVLTKRVDGGVDATVEDRERAGDSPVEARSAPRLFTVTQLDSRERTNPSSLRSHYHSP